MSVKVRFPPSPTGYCHVGTARMALLNYAFARKQGGHIVFRSEDTDKERSTKEFEDDVIESVRWLGLSWDSFFRQSERTATYREALGRLLAEGKAYLSQEPSKKEEGKMAEVVRLRNPGKRIVFSDIIRGDISFDTAELKDFVIARAVDDPIYHLSVVVDDALMGITHVIRGEEHISNTPRQILIQEALGYERPLYAHYPLFLGADKSKLSKRKGDVAVRDYRAEGFLPEALVNFIGVLGWTPPSGKEIFSLQEMVAEFDLADLHKSGAVFDTEKLRWYNRQYLSQKSESDFSAYALPALQEAIGKRALPWSAAIAEKLMSIVRERIAAAEDIAELAAAGEFDFFFADPAPEASRIPDKKSSPQEALKHLQYARSALAALEPYTGESVKEALWQYATEHGRASVLWPLRYALTGKDKSPDPFAVAAIVGREATLRRIDSATQALSRL